MSRHTFAGRAGTTVAISWDRPLASFFVQVTKPHPEEEGETDMLVWLGTSDGPAQIAARPFLRRS